MMSLEHWGALFAAWLVDDEVVAEDLGTLEYVVEVPPGFDWTIDVATVAGAIEWTSDSTPAKCLVRSSAAHAAGLSFACRCHCALTLRSRKRAAFSPQATT